MNARILLVAADPEPFKILSGLLAAETFELELAATAESGNDAACSDDFDLVILDALPAVCGELRRKGIDTSILLLTARARSEERINGLKLGADDCVSRACDSNELLARIEALLRRVPRARQVPIRTLRFGDVEVDFTIAQARKAGHPLTMASKELRLLQYLVDHRERVVSRKEILRHVWEYDAAVSSRTVDVHIGWLRQKLEDDPRQPKYIKTIRGRGYRFDLDDQRMRDRPVTQRAFVHAEPS